MDKKLVLGLDIGVASVGWGIIDKETGLVIDKGVRLFSELNPENNASRRGFRHIRRSLRRKEFRLYRTKKILMEMGLISDLDFIPFDNPYEIRSKGLREKLTNRELATAILHLMKRNGFRYSVADDEEGGVKNIKEEYLCDHQLKLLQETGKIRGTDNKYHFSIYKKEFIKLLETQQINEFFKQKLLDIFEKRRHFEEGPGSANSPSIYGRYLYLGAEPINLIEKMRGHCSIYKEELRAPKVCPSSEIFNLLNDLNNIKVNGNYIGSEKKQIIFESYILDKGKITFKQLENVLGYSSNQISGYRINDKKKPIITEITSLQKIYAACERNNLPEFEIHDVQDIYTLDAIFEILTHTKSIEERFELLEKNFSNEFDAEHLKAFANIKGVSEYHSLSLKAIRELTQEMFETNKNSQQIIVTMDNQCGDTKELKLPKDAIMSPVVAKSVNQTFRIIKAVMKKYGVLNTVMIEMTREKNSKEEKKKIEESLARRTERKEEVLKLLKDHEIIEEKITRDLIDKVRLYMEQDGKSVYSLKPIDLNDLLHDPSAFEIDHIIPYSVSFDDSWNNKVLVYSKENQDKGQRTPYQAMALHLGNFATFLEFEAYVNTNPNICKKKKSNLLNKDDIYAGEVREQFINRNLSDTRYITRTVLNCLKKYFANNQIDTKVHVVNGALTSKIREKAKLKKYRNFYCHHAVDALLIASMLKSKYLEKAFDNYLVDEETGEVFTLADEEEILGPVAKAVAGQIKTFDPIKDYKFSYQVDKKPNRSICDQTLYGTKVINGVHRVVKKYKNIYDKKDGEKVAKMIRENSPELSKFLLTKYDAKTFVILQKICMSYPEAKNPFAEYQKEHGFIRKYSKNARGPIIQSLRYLEDELGTHLDLSHKYKTPPKNSKTIRLQLSPFRMDLYYSKTEGYKFITIRYADVRTKGGEYYIDEEFYKLQKESMKIDDSYKFVNSYFRGDLMKRITDESTIFEVFKAVNNPKIKTIELSFFGSETMKPGKNGELTKFQNLIVVSKKIKDIQKYSTDILGNKFLVTGETLKLRWK